MAELNNNVAPQVPDTVLTGFAREALDTMFEEDADLFDTMFPLENIDDVDWTYNSTSIHRRPAGEYRTWDAQGKMSRLGHSGEAATHALPPITMKDVLGEYDRLKVRRYSDDRLRNAILNPTEGLVGTVYDRLRIGMAELVDTGRFTLPENGLGSQVVDYGRAAGNTTTVANLWTGAGADEVTDLMAAYQAWLDAGNTGEAQFVMTRVRRQGLLTAQSMIDYVTQSGNPSTRRIRQVQVDETLQELELPSINVFDAQVTVINPANKRTTITQRLLDEKAIYVMPRFPVGQTVMGTTAEELDYELSGGPDAGGIIAMTYQTPDPYTKWTKVAGAGMPVFSDGQVDSVVKVTVAA